MNSFQIHIIFNKYVYKLDENKKMYIEADVIDNSIIKHTSHQGSILLLF